MKALFITLITTLAVSFSQGVYYGPHGSCGRSDLLSVRDFAFSPHPVEVPGAISLTAQASLLRPLNASLEAKVTLQKKILDFGFGTLDLGRLGTFAPNPISKTFHVHDVCSQLPGHCAVLSPLGLPCRCSDALPGDYSVTRVPIPIPELGRFARMPVLQNLLFGEWNVRVELFNSASQAQIFCYELDNVRLVKKPPPPQPRGQTLLTRAKNFFGSLFG